MARPGILLASVSHESIIRYSVFPFDGHKIVAPSLNVRSNHKDFEDMPIIMPILVKKKTE
jgi:hypothetical protein